MYIGQYSEGTTSKMRADQIKAILSVENFQIINTHIPFFRTLKIFRSLGFRYKLGPLVYNTNTFIQKQIKSKNYDLIWVDKGMILSRRTLMILKDNSKKLIHFTPDMAFYENKSNKFISNINLFDYVITTKSKEIPFYEELVDAEKIILTTQGFDKNIHKSYHEFRDKTKTVVFIGLAEDSRFKLVKFLLMNDIEVTVVGKGWGSFSEKYKDNTKFNFLGESIFGEDYSKLISSSMFSLGMLSKRFPELHTTRTFEIPACGTALLTERNQETTAFYKEDEVVFYSSNEELLDKLSYYMNNLDELEKLTNKGKLKVMDNGFDYKSIIKNVLLKTIGH